MCSSWEKVEFRQGARKVSGVRCASNVEQSTSQVDKMMWPKVCRTNMSELIRGCQEDSPRERLGHRQRQKQRRGEERPGEDRIDAAGREDDKSDDARLDRAEGTIRRDCGAKRNARSEVCQTDAF